MAQLEDDRLEWPDGESIPYPRNTTAYAAKWAARFTDWILHDQPEPEQVERAFQGLLDEERQITLYRVELFLRELFSNGNDQT